jgi:hypothetical protein
MVQAPGFHCGISRRCLPPRLLEALVAHGVQVRVHAFDLLNETVNDLCACIHAPANLVGDDRGLTMTDTADNHNH